METDRFRKRLSLLGVAVGWLGTLVAGKLLFDSVIMPNTAITVANSTPAKGTSNRLAIMNHVGNWWK